MALRGVFEAGDFPWTARPDQVQARVDLLRSSLPPGAVPRRLLDLGCGGGENTLALARGLGAGAAVGLDWATGPLARAQGAGLPGVCGRLDGADLPFPEGAFDVVAMTEVIEHLVDTDLALEEARRVLAPGGLLLVTTPNLAAWFNRALLGAGVQPVFSEVSTRKIYGRPGTEVVGHLRLFTRRALVELLADLGFADIRVAGAPFHGVPRPLRPLDRFLSRRPEVAACLLAVATKAASEPEGYGEGVAVRPAVHRFTRHEYHQMASGQVFGEDDRVELIDGEVVEMAPIGSPHAAGVNRLTTIFSSAVAGRAIVAVQNPIALSELSEPEPDLALLRPRPDFYAQGHPRPEDVLLLVEVADTSVSYERRVKLPLYLAAGITEIWVVDLPAEALEVTRGTETQRRGRGDTVAPLAFPDMVVEVDAILG